MFVLPFMVNTDV